MEPDEFLSKLDEAAIVQAIAEAERHSSGQIRVYVSHQKGGDALARAQARFLSLGMEKTRRRNAVLLHFAPRDRQFAVVGDTGVHKECGPAFWEAVSQEVRSQLKEGRFMEAVLHGVRKVGNLLAEHFPPRPGGEPDELSNQIIQD